MLKGRDDIDRVLEIARRYNVTVCLDEDFPRGFSVLSGKTDANTRGCEVRALTSSCTDGPIWHRCDAAKKIVWFHHFDLDEVETHLHEVMHCIVQPPGGNIERLSEDVVLMPFERVLARQCLSLEGYKRVVAWQLSTQIEWWSARDRKYYGALADVPNYTRYRQWRQSHAELRKMGAIKNGRVTWKPLNWKLASKELLDRGNLG